MGEELPALRSRLQVLKQASSLHPLSACCVAIGDQLLHDIIREVSGACVSATPQELTPRETELLEGVLVGREPGSLGLSATLRDLLAAEVEATEQSVRQMTEIPLMSGSDIFGNHTKQVVDTLTCTNCGTQIAANRFAPHLERCMLGKGRASARVARDMMRSTAAE